MTVAIEKVLEDLAFRQAASSAAMDHRHGSRLGRLPVGSWQADLLRESPGTALARTPDDLRHLMSKDEAAMIFVPHDGVLSLEMIERICRESAYNKLIIRETEA